MCARFETWYDNTPRPVASWRGKGEGSGEELKKNQGEKRGEKI